MDLNKVLRQRVGETSVAGRLICRLSWSLRVETAGHRQDDRTLCVDENLCKSRQADVQRPPSLCPVGELLPCEHNSQLTLTFHLPDSIETEHREERGRGVFKTVDIFLSQITKNFPAFQDSGHFFLRSPIIRAEGQANWFLPEFSSS